ncbi:hypothetical protein DMENIID0001_130760 [Sergentomyia squamirostris]
MWKCGVYFCVLSIVINIPWIIEAKDSLSKNFLDNLEETFAKKWSMSNVEEIDEMVRSFVNFGNHKRVRRDTQWSPSDHFKLIGFDAIISIPISFPLDFCMLSVFGSTYIIALHANGPQPEDIKNGTEITFLQLIGSNLVKIYEQRLPESHGLECISVKNYAFIAVIGEFKKNTKELGTPVYQIMEKSLKIVHYSRVEYQLAAKFWTLENDIFLMQTSATIKLPLKIREKFACPIYKWNFGGYFEVWDEILCSNAATVDAFRVDQNNFLAIANTIDERNNTKTSSKIYRFEENTHKYIHHQSIVTDGVVDLKHFRADDEDYLIVVNSGGSDNLHDNDISSHSIIYKFSNGYFLPLQRIQTVDATAVLPVPTLNDKILLLFSCREEPMKIYEYDGWEFKESPVKYTAESFDFGISKMRAYKAERSYGIVIANQRVFGEIPNVFVPQYKAVPNYDVHAAMLEWCEDRLQDLTSFDLEGVVHVMQNFPKKTDDVIELTNGVEFSSLNLGKLKTKEIKTMLSSGIESVLNEKTAKEINTTQDSIRLLGEKIHVINETLKHYLNADVQVRELLSQNQQKEETTTELPNSDYDYEELTVEDLRVEFINGQPVEKLIFKNSPLNLSKITIDCENVTILNNVTVKNHLDGIKFNRESVLLRNSDHQRLNFTALDTLIVRDIHLDSINSVNFSKIVNAIKELKPMVPNITAVKADNLYITGLVNDIDFSILEKHALRKEGNQIITEVTNIDHLVADQVNAFKKISKKDWSDAVIASSGDFHLDYPVSFHKNISVKNLTVLHQLNHINVFDGELDVVLSNSTETQIIQGKKMFQHVKLLKPIILQGKIKSESLEKMNPMASVTQNIVLEGDYYITGPVTVKRHLRIGDLVTANNSLSLKNLYTNGLSQDTIEIYQNINFLQPLRVFDFYTKSLNGINPETLVKTNTEEIQTIQTKKVFKSGLEIHEGFCDAAIVQGINLTELDQDIVHKNGDETIEGDIQFRKISANRIQSDSATFSGRNFTNLLHFDKEQVITGRAGLKNSPIIVKNLTIKNLQSKGRINNVVAGDLVHDTANRTHRIVLNGTKTFTGGLVIGNLNINHLNTSFVTGDSVQKITLNSTEFDSEISIKEILYYGQFSGIESSDFGTAWLLTEGDQDFTALQIFSSNVSIQNQLSLFGSFNEHNLEEFYNNSYFINREEVLPSVKFLDDIMLFNSLTLNGTLSGHPMPQLLNKRGKTSYKIPKLTINGNLYVDKNNIWILDSINNIYMPALVNFAQPSSAGTLHNLVVHGNVTFNIEPNVIYLNSFNIRTLFENALMVYNKIFFAESLHLSEADFLGQFLINGKINGINMTYVALNFLSLTGYQKILPKITFLNWTTLETTLSASEVHIGGFLGSPDSDETVKVEDLAENAAKLGGNQTITGNWTVQDVIVDGDVENDLINGVNIEDFMRKDVEFNNVTGLKRLHHLVMQNLQCEGRCIVQDVNINQWFADAVFLIGNHTIHDTVTLRAGIFHTDITVHGLVNNITFNPDTILTKDNDQIIEGNIYIDNRSKDKTRLHSLTFHKLDTVMVNDENVDDFLTNVATTKDYSIGTNFVETPVVFEKPLTVQNLQCPGHLFGMNMSELTEEMELAQDLSTIEKKLTKLYEKTKNLVEHHASGNAFYVTHYTVAQILPGIIKKIVPIELQKNGKINLYLAILAGSLNDTIIKFYRIDEFQRKQFIESDIKAIRFADGDIASIGKLHLLGQDFLFTEKYSHEMKYKQTIFHYVQDNIKVIYERFTKTPRRIASVKQDVKSECIVEYSVKDSEVSVECLSIYEAGNISWVPYQKLKIVGIKEILPLRINMFAVLTANGTIAILQHHPGKKWQEKQTLPIINPLDMSSENFEGHLFLAICSGQTRNSVHHGSVEIFRHIGKQFVHFQHIPIESPTRISFSILPTGEFVLYVLTGNPGQPLIVYIYSGISGFRQFVVGSTVARGHRLTVIQLPRFRKEFVAVISTQEASLVEAIMR